MTDAGGDVLERYDYTVFGEVTVLDAGGTALLTQPEPLSPWLFHGRLHEPETGLYWMRARHYHPRLGRFLQPDPIGVAGGSNLYAYANNNPLRWFDPWGLMPETAASIVGSTAYANGNPVVRVNPSGHVIDWEGYQKDVQKAPRNSRDKD